MKKKRSAKQKEIKLPFFLTKETIIVASLLLLAIIFRLIYLSHLKVNDPGFYNPPQGTDMLTYNNYAKQILDGTFSSTSKEPYYYGPLYFYFLALIYKIFGIDPYIARFIQMILGVLTTFLTYLIAKKVFNKTVGYISLVISILYGMFYIHEGVLLMESLITFLNISTVFLLLRSEDNPSYKNLAYSGISLGLSALARANILLFIPLILVLMLFNSKLKTQNSKLLRYCFLCLIILLTISPVTIRNYLASGKFVLISTNGPVSLWIGNNRYASGEFKYPPSPYNEMIAEKVKEKGEKVYIEEIVSFIKKEPKAFINLLFKKFLLFWSSYEINNNLNPLIQKNYSALLKLPIFLGFGIIAPLSLLGIILSIKHRNSLLLSIFVVAGMLALVIIFVLERYRACFMPVLIVFSSFSLYWYYKRIKKKMFDSLIVSIIPLFLSVGLVYSQDILGIAYHLFYPGRRHYDILSERIIKDNSDNERLSKEPFVLNGQFKIKKKLVITEEIQKFKEAILFFSYTTEEGTLIININDKIEGGCNFGSTNGLLQNGSLRECIKITTTFCNLPISL